MDAFVSIMPVFAVVAVGYLCVRFKVVTIDVADSLAAFVFNIALPAYIFRSIVRYGMPKNLENYWELLGAYYLGALAILLIAMVISRYAFSGTQTEQSMFGVGASHSNILMMGFPVALYVMGAKLTLPILLIVATHGVLMAVMLGIVLRVRMGKGGEVFAAIGQTLLDHIKNPILIALIAGIVYAALGGPKIVKEVDTILRLLGRAAVPCALFAMGGMLVRYKIQGSLATPLAICAIKLVAFPAVVWLLAKHVFSVPTSWTLAAMILAAMPTSFNMHKLMKRSESGSAAASSAIVLSTILSAVAVAVIIKVV